MQTAMSYGAERLAPAAASRPSSATAFATPAARHAAGFTLLEVLVVLTILAVLTGTVMLAFTGADQEQNLRGAAERLAMRIELARQHALTRNREWGIYVEADTYHFAEFDPEQSIWVKQTGRPFDRPDLPALVSLSLDLEEFDSLPFDENDDLPQILIFSSGEITPFRLLLEPEWRALPWALTSDGLSQVEASRDDEALL